MGARAPEVTAVIPRNASASFAPNEDRKGFVSSFEAALRVGAEGISIPIHPGVPRDDKMHGEPGRIGRDCQCAGRPFREAASL
jgi:DhnA family fructose-bisphosphate aldolase class Ia